MHFLYRGDAYQQCFYIKAVPHSNMINNSRDVRIWDMNYEYEERRILSHKHLFQPHSRGVCTQSTHRKRKTVCLHFLCGIAQK